MPSSAQLSLCNPPSPLFFPVQVVESDKADMDVESFAEGILGSIVVPEGGVANGESGRKKQRLCPVWLVGRGLLPEGGLANGEKTVEIERESRPLVPCVVG